MADSTPTAAVGDNADLTLQVGPPGDAPADASPVTIAERYVLLREIGRGATGVVWRAYDRELDRAVAVKLLVPTAEFVDEPSRWRRSLRREARALARLSDANVVAVHDVGFVESDDPSTTRNRAFIVMELVDGGTLSQWLDAEPRPPSKILEAFIAAGRGLVAAHRVGLVHRDFKPQNVLMATDGTVKVVDFGLAIERGEPSHEREDADPSSMPPEPEPETVTHGVVGTPPYMAPEQHRGEPADARSDQYAFCASLFRALYGSLPFEGPDLLAQKERGLSRLPLSGGVPGRVRAVVRRGLSPSPEDRFPSMEALVASLPPRRWPRAAVVAVLLTAALVPTIDRIADRFEPGTLTLSVVDPAGEPVEAELHIDGEWVATATDGQWQAPLRGRHLLEVTAEGHIPVSSVIEVEPRGEVDRTIRLQHQTGVVMFEVVPAGATVRIDGVDYGSRIRNLPLPIGPHELLVSMPGHYEQRQSFALHEGETWEGGASLSSATRFSMPLHSTGRLGGFIDDLDGDGTAEMAHTHFNRLLVTNPSSGASAEVRGPALLELPVARDLDGDGRAELLALAPADPYTLIAARAPRGPLALRSLWELKLAPATGRGFRRAGRAIVPLGRNEGALEFAVVAADSALTAFRGRDGAKTWSAELDGHVLAVATEGRRLVVATEVAVHDLDPATGRSRGHYLFDATKETFRAPGRDAAVAPIAGDLGGPVVAIVGSGPNGVSVGKPLEGERWWSAAGRGFLADPPSALDADEDGFGDIVVYRLDEEEACLLSGRDGRQLWCVQGVDPRGIAHSETACDVVTVHGDRTALLDCETGELRPKEEAAAPTGWVTARVDWRGVGKEEVVVISADSVLQIIAPDGALVARAPLPRVRPVETGATIVRDSDGNGLPELIVDAGGPVVVEGTRECWWQPLGEAVRGRPVVEDIDGDGRLELFLAGENRDVRGVMVFDARTGKLEATASVATLGSIRGPLAIPRASGGFDVYTTFNQNLARYEGPSARLHLVPTGTTYATPVVLGDDIMTMDWYDGMLRMFDRTTLRPRREYKVGEGAWAAPVLVDLDADTRPKVVLAGLEGNVTAVDLDDDTIAWKTPLGGRMIWRPAVTRIDDADALVVTVQKPPQVVALAATTGDILWRYEPDTEYITRAEAADVDGDGADEIFVPISGRICRLDVRGQQRWCRPRGIGEPDVPPSAPVAVADAGGDRLPELLLGWSDGRLTVHHAADAALAWHFDAQEEVEADPVVVDVDGDDVPEIFIGSHARRVWCLHGAPRP